MKGVSPRGEASSITPIPPLPEPGLPTRLGSLAAEGEKAPSSLLSAWKFDALIAEKDEVVPIRSAVDREVPVEAI